jgi:hypothetical protein
MESTLIILVLFSVFAWLTIDIVRYYAIYEPVDVFHALYHRRQRRRHEAELLEEIEDTLAGFRVVPHNTRESAPLLLSDTWYNQAMFVATGDLLQELEQARLQAQYQQIQSQMAEYEDSRRSTELSLRDRIDASLSQLELWKSVNFAYPRALQDSITSPDGVRTQTTELIEQWVGETLRNSNSPAAYRTIRALLVGKYRRLYELGIKIPIIPDWLDLVAHNHDGFATLEDFGLDTNSHSSSEIRLLVITAIVNEDVTAAKIVLAYDDAPIYNRHALGGPGALAFVRHVAVKGTTPFGSDEIYQTLLAGGVFTE